MKKYTLLLITITVTLYVSAQINLDSGLVAYYPLDSTLVDHSPFAIEGININGAVCDTGKNNVPNTAFKFNGIDQYIDCGTNQRGITDKVSVSAWVKKTGTAAIHEHMVTKYRGGNGTIQQGFHFVLRTDGHPVFAGRLGQSGSAGYYKIIADEVIITDGTWHHLLGTVDQNEWNFWVDGIHIGTVIGNSPNPSLICPDILSIGHYPEVQSYYFGGTIDEVRVYNRILNGNEISLLSDISFIDSTYLNVQDTQAIALQVNWSLFSTYIDPVYPQIDSVLFDILSNVTIVKDGDGMVFWPQFGINTIDTITFWKGYAIKSVSSQTFQVTGTKYQPELVTLPIPLGWSIISYLRDNPAPADTMFNSITGFIEIVKNGSGYVYWPAFGLNLIGNLQPGEGYQVKLNAAQNFTYPAN